jgi:hypothetical protein
MSVPPVHILGATNRDRPFQRINIPAARFVKLFRSVPGVDIFATPVNGRGYDCGCRSSKDYDGKIGKDIGDKTAEILEKIVPIFAAAKAAKDGLAKLLKGLPLIGPTLSNLVDNFDPLKSLLEFIGEKLDALLVDSLVRSIPAWVPVFRTSPQAAQLVEAEVEGVLVRSHQRHDGIPYSQWHLWYDWTFLVSPVGNTAGLVGEGNRQRTRADADLKDSQEKSAALDARRYERGWMPGGSNLDQTIQCEWDLGAIGITPPGPFLNSGPPRIDWGWPMAGQYFWATGRNVYDCSHATGDEKKGDNAGLHLNQLHPLKALATLRWEGFLFKENLQAVPAAQFMLFASRTKPSGGNFRFDSINDLDWEFVVQLPPGGGIASDDPYSIGSTDKFKLNTLDIGRRLLVDVPMKPFADASLHRNTNVFDFRPVVTPLVIKDGNGAPTHVRIQFPMKVQVADQIENFGLIVSLGWHDPSGVLARTVHKVTIAFTEVQIFDAKDNSGAEWMFNFAANGRWFQRTFVVAGSTGTQRFSDATVVLFLSEDDVVQVAAHGLEEDGQGDEYRLPDTDPDPTVPDKDEPKSKFDEFMQRFINSRKLRLSRPVDVPTGVDDKGQVKTERIDLPFVGEAVDWNRDMDQPLDQRDTETVKAKASEVARALFLRNARIAFDANDLIGFVDPNIFDPKKQALGRRNDAQDSPNPLSVRDLIGEVGLGGTKTCQQTAYAMTQLGRMGMIGYEEDPINAPPDARIFHGAKVDYILRYTVKIEAQPPAPPPPPFPPAP